MQSNIRQLRIEKQISQAELGEALGMSQQIVSRMERDRSKIQVSSLIALADYFQVSTDCILGYHQRSAVRTFERRFMASPMDENSEREIEDLRQKVDGDGRNALFGLLVDLKHYMLE